MLCTSCKKPHGKKSWISFVGTSQCSRLWCRFKTGHLFQRWCTTHLKRDLIWDWDFRLSVKYEKGGYLKVLCKLPRVWLGPKESERLRFFRVMSEYAANSPRHYYR